MYIYPYMYMHVCMYIFMHIYLYTNIYIYNHIYIYMYKYICIHIYIHTYIYIGAQPSQEDGWNELESVRVKASAMYVCMSHTWIMSRTWTSHVSWVSYATHMNESLSHLWWINEWISASGPCNICIVCLYVINASCHAREQVMSH